MRRRILDIANATVRARRVRDNTAGGGSRGADETLPEADGSPWCDRIHARCRRFCGCTASTSPRDVEPESTLEPPSPPPQARFLLAPGEERRGATVPAHPQLQPLPSCWWRAPGAGGRPPSTSMSSSVAAARAVSRLSTLTNMSRSPPGPSEPPQWLPDGFERRRRRRRVVWEELDRAWLAVSIYMVVAHYEMSSGFPLREAVDFWRVGQQGNFTGSEIFR